jgi:hypothetical protein
MFTPSSMIINPLLQKLLEDKQMHVDITRLKLQGGEIISLSMLYSKKACRYSTVHSSFATLFKGKQSATHFGLLFPMDKIPITTRQEARWTPDLLVKLAKKKFPVPLLRTKLQPSSPQQAKVWLHLTSLPSSLF